MERNKFNIVILFALLPAVLLLIPDGVIFAGDNSPLIDPFPSLRHGVGSAALAMGGTGVVNAVGAEAVLWNPARIVTRDRVCLAMFGSQSSNRSGDFSGLPQPQFFFAGITYKIKDTEWLIFDRPTIGLALYHFNISGLSVIGVDPISATPLITPYDDEGQTDVLLVLPFATNVLYSDERLSIGFNLLTHYHTMFSHSSEVTLGWDMGVNWDIIGEPIFVQGKIKSPSSAEYFLRTGARMRHLNGIKWKPGDNPAGYTQNDWNYLDVGMAFGYRNLEESFFKCITFATQVRLDENKDFHLSVGGELALKSINLRVGGDNITTNYAGDSYKLTNTTFTFGIGIHSFESMKQYKGLHLDYCHRMYLDNTNVWMKNENNLTLGYRF